MNFFQLCLMVSFYIGAASLLVQCHAGEVSLGNSSGSQSGVDYEYQLFDSNCCTIQKNEVLKYVGDEPLPDSIRPLIEVLQVDLNEDGLDDFIARLISPIHCGTSGCRAFIFIAHDKGLFSEVAGPANVHNEVAISRHRTRGMFDLYFRGESDSNCLWQWTGQRYVFQQCK